MGSDLHSHGRITDVTSEREVAVSAARRAGEVLRGGFGAEHEISYKGEVDLVTEVDEEAERVIRQVLLGVFPAYGMLAEEGGGQTGEGDARWIVDPLDGTTNYAHGLPLFAVSIALERAGEVVLGVVHDPVHDETCVAGRDGGATLTGEPIRASETEEPIRALISTGLPYDRESIPEALDLCYVACGRLDEYYERGIRPWDVAAGSLILQESGGTVTDYRGTCRISKAGRWWRATGARTRRW